MQQTITADIDALPSRLFPVVADLATYPHWLDLVTKVDPDGDAWFVTLRAKVGPFARSKRLRMVRTVHQEPTTVRFERQEQDGRNHSPWVMDATISARTTPAGPSPAGPSPAGSTSAPRTGSHVLIVLSYGGRLWSGPLEAVLGSQVSNGVPRLQQYVTAPV